MTNVLRLPLLLLSLVLGLASIMAVSAAKDVYNEILYADMKVCEGKGVPALVHTKQEPKKVYCGCSGENWIDSIVIEPCKHKVNGTLACRSNIFWKTVADYHNNIIDYTKASCQPPTQPEEDHPSEDILD